MAKLLLRSEKTASDGSTVTMLQNANDHGWYVGHKGDPRFEPIPLGAFQSKDAARRYADHNFPGGDWKDVG
jgi:hypothetical protein